MTAPAGELVDSAMIQNSWSDESSRSAENKMHELAVVNALHQARATSSVPNNGYNFVELSTASDQHPPKYAVLHVDADSTVMDSYSFEANQQTNAYSTIGGASMNEDGHIMDARNSTMNNNHNDLLEQQQVYYDHQTANGNYQYADTNQVNQINQFNDQLMTNQTYDYNEQAPPRNSAPSINSFSSSSSNSSQSAAQLLDLNTYNHSHPHAATKPTPTSNRQDQATRSSTHRANHTQHSKTSHHYPKHYSTNKATASTVDRKLLRPHSTPATLIWLEENYEIADGVCIPRSTLYMHYVDFCSKNRIQPVNAASFGKIIRQKFPQLTTRRLGTRGQSRYHYYGIAVKENSIYHQQAYSKKGSSAINSSSSSSFAVKEATSVASVDKLRNADYCFRAGHKDSSPHYANQSSTAANDALPSIDYQQHQSANNQNFQNQSQPPTGAEVDHLNGSNSVSHNGPSTNPLSNSLSISSISNGHHGPTVNLPAFPNVKELRLGTRSHLSSKHLIGLYSTFLMMYRTNCQRILDTLIRCNLSELNTFISYFWQAVPEHLKCVLAEPVFHCLIAICDCILYKCMTQILSAPLLQSNCTNLPDNLIKILAKFSDQLEWNTKTAMCKQPESLRCVKLALSRKSACLLRRQSCLSRYICETRIALSTDHNARKMLITEFRKVDISLIFGELLNKLNDYQIQIITTAIGEFEILLEDAVVDNWLNWINGLLNKCISYPSHNMSFAIHAKQFVRIWNAFSFGILKQLNGMTSPFYKLFILIRNLFDVYILYTLEYLHFDERIKEFTLSLYKNQCPAIVEPFFADSPVFDFNSDFVSDFRMEASSVSNIKAEPDIKLEMNEPSTIVSYFNNKHSVINSGGYDAEMYSSSFYNSDYYPQTSIPHEGNVFPAFNGNNYHRHQFASPSASANYQPSTDFNNHFHPMTGYFAGQSTNHHHLHHHLHQQTYHLIINNTSTNNIDSTHYHIDQPDSSQTINYNLNSNIVPLPFQPAPNELINSADPLNCNTTIRKCDQLTNDHADRLTNTNCYQNGVY